METPRSFQRAHAAVFSLLSASLLSASVVKAQNAATPEKKVDYLERIYFSGENKEGLLTKIQIAMQEIVANQPTPAVAKQAAFLEGIEARAEEAKNACEVLDLLAVGIYELDAAEASMQGIKRPSKEVKEKSGNALDALGKLGGLSGDMGNSARELQWGSVLSTGKYGDFAKGAGKVGNLAEDVTRGVDVLDKGAKTGKQLFDMGKKMGIKIGGGDKPCKNVTPKTIEIGDHTPMGAIPNAADNKLQAQQPTAATTTVINIQSVGSADLRTLCEALKTKEGVQSAEKTFSATASTITVVHTGGTDALADWIEEKFASGYKMIDYASGKINMAAKPAKAK